MSEPRTFCEDWCVYFRADNGSWWSYNSEMWGGWIDLPEGTDVQEGAVDRHVLPWLLSFNDVWPLLDLVPSNYWPSLESASTSAAEAVKS